MSVNIIIYKELELNIINKEDISKHYNILNTIKPNILFYIESFFKDSNIENLIKNYLTLYSLNNFFTKLESLIIKYDETLFTQLNTLEGNIDNFYKSLLYYHSFILYLQSEKLNIKDFDFT